MAATKQTTAKKRRSTLRQRNTILGWSFILPNFLGFFLLHMVPIIVLFYLAFTKASMYAMLDAKWIGLGNFQRLIHNTAFRTALWNTFYYAIPHILLTGAMALGLAQLLNRKLKAVSFFRAAAFFPYITSIVALAIVWNLMFSQGGPINSILDFFGLQPTNGLGWTTMGVWGPDVSKWAGSPAMWAVIIVGTWREMGYYMLLFLAGLQTIPGELYEAARVDGATAFQRFLNITWPGLRPTTFFIMVILSIESFKVLDITMVMTEGGPGTSTTVISQYIYRQAFENNDPGYASAVSLVLFAICLTLTIIQYLINKRSQ